MSRFKHYPKRPKKLTAAFAKREYQKLLKRLPLAERSKKPGLWLELFADWNALKSYIGSEAGRISYHYSKDMRNQELEAQERYIREKITVVVDKPEYTLTKALVSSRHRNAIAGKYGKILPVQYKLWLEPLDPINTALGVKNGNLSTEYEKLTAKAEVTVRGETINLYKARSLEFSPDSKLRREAYLAKGDWFLENHKKLSAIYSKLVTNRDQMGKNLGYDNYIPLAYKNRSRIGYDADNVEAFRNLVQKHAVPALREVLKARAKNLGQPTVRPWDTLYDPRCDMPLGCAPVSSQLDSAERLFERLSPKLADHFKKMRQRQLIDLETRHGKQAGAYCTEFSDEETVVIFCNSTGDVDDVRTLIHEMGHAFQFWESQHIEAVDLQVGSAELAEIYSMGMEFLSLPYINEFFNAANSRKFVIYKWIDSIFSLCYMCVVDEFQHWVYENFNASVQERDDKWIEIYSKYLPGVDFSGLEKYGSTRWYAQRHIFVAPFYYIDYALAEVCAMQLAVIADRDHKTAVKKYLQMCKIGGTKSFIDAVDSAGLRSPFDEGTLTEVIGFAKKVLV